MVARLFAEGIFPDKVSAPPSAKAYKNACEKLPPKVVEQFQQQSHKQSYATIGQVYEDYKVLIVDGTKVSMPASDEVVEKYGMGTGHYAQSQAVGFYELSTGTFESVTFDHMDRSERSIAQEHMQANRTRSLYLADAGYNGMAFVAATTEKGHDLLMPLKTKGHLGARFRESGERSAIFSIKLTGTHLKRYPEYHHLNGQTIQVRLIRCPGTTKLRSQVLITTLLDEDRHPWQRLCALYRQRYSIELAFRHLKQKIGLERIRKRTLHRIEQRLFAAVAVYNMTAIIRNRLQKPRLLPPESGVKMICFSFCMSGVGLFVKAVLKPVRGMMKTLKQHIKAMRACRFTYIPWRICPRICYTPSSKFSTQKATEAKGEIEKAQFLAQEFAILKEKYEALGA